MIKKIHLNGPMRAVIYREDRWWIAHCLELDIVAEGDTPEKAAEDLLDLVRFHIKAAVEDGDVTSLFKPAPAEIMKMFFLGKSMKTPTPQRSPKAHHDLETRSFALH